MHRFYVTSQTMDGGVGSFAGCTGSIFVALVNVEQDLFIFSVLEVTKGTFVDMFVHFYLRRINLLIDC